MWSSQTWDLEVKRVLAELQALLRPGGSIVILETLGTLMTMKMMMMVVMMTTINTKMAMKMMMLTKHHARAGTGNEEPNRRNLMYSLLEEVGFRFRWFRTDYRFADWDEAVALSRFFFGNKVHPPAPTLHHLHPHHPLHLHDGDGMMVGGRSGGGAKSQAAKRTNRT